MSRRAALSAALVLSLSLLLLAAGCGDEGGGGSSDGNNAANNNPANNNPVNNNPVNNSPVNNNAPTCGAGEPWVPGEPVFREVTEAWGLVGVQGQRMNVVDVDGDGWADVLVRQGGSVPDVAGSDAVPRVWLLRNTGEGRFEDVTAASGLRAPRGVYAEGWSHPGEVYAFGDVNNDGHIDAVAAVHTLDPNNPTEERSEIYLGSGDGTFRLGPETSGLRRDEDAPSGAALVDYDRDGSLDLWLSQAVPSGARSPAQDRLFRGDGLGGFEDVTESARLQTYEWSLENLNFAQAHTFAWSAAACDLNNDGDPDLLAASYGRQPNNLWRAERSNSGRVRYVNESIASGYAFDAEQDWRDNESARCWCKLHPLDAECAGVPEPSLIRCTQDSDAFRWSHESDREPYRLGGNSGGTTCADVNNDGWLDLMTSEIVHWDVGSSSDPSQLLVNRQDPLLGFDRPGNAATGLTREHAIVDWNDGDITNAVFDFDNDGWPDIYVGSTDYPGARGLLYHQDAPLEFSPVPLEDGIDNTRSHGSVIADFDHDGDLDILVGHSRARCGGSTDCYPTANVRLFENLTGARNAWLQLDLRGAAGTNTLAVGARVEVTAGGVTQTQEVGGGHGHYGSQNDRVLHFGLGSACAAEVTVRWPDADLTVETFTLEANGRYVVTQGDGATPAAP